MKKPKHNRKCQGAKVVTLDRWDCGVFGGGGNNERGGRVRRRLIEERGCLGV
jgi:hypothetical protein